MSASNDSDPTKNFWHYAIDGDRRGPVPVDAIADLVKSGDIDSETFVWQPGMADWALLKEVPALQFLVAAEGGGDDLADATLVAALPESVREEVAQAWEPDDDDQLGATMIQDVSEVFAPSDDSDSGVGDLFGGAEEEDDASDEIYGRRESSVLFSLDELGRDDSAKDGSQDDQFVTESSGLIDIGAIASSTSGQKDDPFGAVAPVKSAAATLSVPIVAEKRNTMPIIIGIAALLLIGVVAFFLLKGGDKPDPVAVAAKSAEVEAAEKAAAEAKATAELALAEAKAAAERERAEREAKEKAEAEAKAAEEKVAAAEAEKEEVKEEKAAAAPKPSRPAPARGTAARPAATAKPAAQVAAPKPAPSKPAPAPKQQAASDVNSLLDDLNKSTGSAPAGGGGGASDANLPQKLSSAAIRNTIRNRFNKCSAMVTNASGSVRVQTQFVIAGSGVVQSARVLDGGGTSSDVQACIVSQLRATTFGKFKDATMQVNLPIRLL